MPLHLPASLRGSRRLVDGDHSRDQKYKVSVGRGQSAVTRYRRLGTVDGGSLVAAEPVTVRTHQLRAHLAHLGHPILGDPKYGRADGEPRLFLHCLRVAVGGEAYASPLPAAFEERLTEEHLQLIARELE